MKNKVSCGLFFFLSLGPRDHANYNWWHSYEHMPEYQVVPSQVHGQRYVATPDLIAARPKGDPAVAATQYLAAYYHSGPPAAAFKERAAFNAWLEKHGPNYTGQRTMDLSGAYRFARAHVVPRLRISAEALLFRPHTGLYVAIDDLTDAKQAKALDDWYDRVHIPQMLGRKGVTGAWRFVSAPHPDFPHVPGRRLHVYFLDEDPASVATALRPAGKAATGPQPPATRPVLASAFRTIYETPGAKYDWFGG